MTQIQPLTIEQLRALAADPESDRVERKESATSGSVKSKILEAICAFSNDLPNHQQPGVIFVGMRDDGRPTGAPITDELLLTLGAMRSDGLILPLPMMTIQKLEIDGAEVAAITVYPSHNPPVRYDGRVWIRVGPRRAVASADEERQLREKRRAQDPFFDHQACPGATIDDIDLQLFQNTYLPSAVAPEIIEENHRSLGAQLASLRLLTPDLLPTNACILLLGKDPQRFLPGSYVQFLRIDGTQYTDPILDQKVINGTLPSMIKTLEDIVRVNIKIGIKIPEFGRDIQTPDYPAQALQQLIINALLHRNYEGTNAPVRLTWYQDRVELLSPGGLYGQLTPESFGAPGVTDYRNPLIAEGLKVFGFVQRFGWGLPRAQQLLAQNNNPPLEPTISSQLISITIRPRRESAP